MSVSPPQRRTQAVPRPAPPATVVHSLDTPGIEQLGEGRFRLPNGTVLAQPKPRFAHELSRFDWVAIGGWPYQVTELREKQGGGKYVHLHGRHRPERLDGNGSLLAFTVLTPS